MLAVLAEWVAALLALVLREPEGAVLSPVLPADLLAWLLGLAGDVLGVLVLEMNLLVQPALEVAGPALPGLHRSVVRLAREAEQAVLGPPGEVGAVLLAEGVGFPATPAQWLAAEEDLPAQLSQQAQALVAVLLLAVARLALSLV